MNQRVAIPSPASNPFATCWTRPGALPFNDTAAATVTRCVATLRATAWRGQVLGPHGVGKTTLLRSIEAAAHAEGLTACWLRGGGPRDPARHPAPADQVVLLDSFDQLSRRARAAWRRRPFGLVVTTHRRVGLPDLCDLSPSAQDALRLFAQLTESRRTPVSRRDCLRCYQHRRGNLREVWFDLYDLHERRSRANYSALDA